jgi:hypothetical protein
LHNHGLLHEKHKAPPIEFHPWQCVELSDFGLTKEQASAKVQVFANGKRCPGHQAFARLLLVQNQWWFKLMGGVLLVPKFSWGAGLGYFSIAKYRPKLSGVAPTCALRQEPQVIR